MNIHIKGIVTSILLGIAAITLSTYTPSWLNSILISLMIGIMLNNFINIPEEFQPGIGFTGSKLLELSVVFLAFNINFKTFTELGIQSFLIIMIMVFSMLLLTYYVAKKIKCPESTGWLIGFGTAICGSSAIAALSPLVTKNKDNVGIAMAVVNLLGTLGMITMPFLLGEFFDSDSKTGMILGSTLHSVGNVAGSAFSVNDAVGETAITIKLARVALLSPGLILFHYLLSKKGSLGEGQPTGFSLPWYLWAFILISLLGSFITYPAPLIEQTEWLGKIILTVAMAATGLKIGFKKLIQTGQKGIIFGILLFAIQFFLVILLMFIFQK
jgi:uncharacterized integral membrane protein (TIGR00698 family)